MQPKNVDLSIHQKVEKRYIYGSIFPPRFSVRSHRIMGLLARTYKYSRFERLRRNIGIFQKLIGFMEVDDLRIETI
jgi:hypothetical protein